MTKWNVMIYLAGDNNLSEEMVWALQQMRAADIGDNIVKVQFDPLGEQIPIQRYKIRKGSSSLYHWADPLPSKPEEIGAFKKWIDGGRKKGSIHCRRRLAVEDTGNPTSLVYFVWWATKRPVSKKRKNMLIISGHGCGFEKDFLLHDDTPRDSLTIKELAQALCDAKHRLGVDRIDIVGMDSCLMSTAEVYYEVRESVHYLVSAEGFESNAGWPYHAVLDNLNGKPAAVASKLVKDYINFSFDYTIGGQSADLSACDVTLHEGLANAVKSLKDVLIPALDIRGLMDAIILAHWRCQSYKSDQSVDLVDFAMLLKDEIARVKDAPGVLMTAIDGACLKVRETLVGSKKNPDKIVLTSGYTGPDFQHSHGLSIHFPWAYYSKDYGNLHFARETKWGDFLEFYVDKTRREPREGYPAVEGIFLDKVMNAPFGRPVGAKDGQKATPDSNRATPDSNRATPDSNRGKFEFVSMKNPPVVWRACDLLKELGCPARNMLKNTKSM